MIKELKTKKALKKIRQHGRKILSYADMIEMQADNGNLEAANEQAMRMEEESEKLTLLTRNLPYYTGKPTVWEDVRECISKIVQVDIGFTEENWFCVRMPTLLPKKEHGSVDYLRQVLFPALNRLFGAKGRVRYEDAVLIFRHVYDKDFPERWKRDHDNYENNQVADIVALYVLPDDSPLFCSRYHTSAVGELNRTEVYVVPKTDFAKWLGKEKSYPREGEKLYETQL